ncbi:hypothetical protein AVEN_164897-1 [Araneus ventricosus]|uniref:Uncharacterized protein n=1 Tax=Araneus ventricosus TaxID=182803 RepID=A0A4Y2DWD3_ARAVE|nr:hypothetical protein AVEN_164897-1 [Araneus ventricosus]
MHRMVAYLDTKYVAIVVAVIKLMWGIRTFLDTLYMYIRKDRTESERSAAHRLGTAALGHLKHFSNRKYMPVSKGLDFSYWDTMRRDTLYIKMEFTPCILTLQSLGKDCF